MNNILISNQPPSKDIVVDSEPALRDEVNNIKKRIEKLENARN